MAGFAHGRKGGLFLGCPSKGDRKVEAREPPFHQAGSRFPGHGGLLLGMVRKDERGTGQFQDPPVYGLGEL
ncbi:hypothetical protein [Peribacillus acanthi]|uniref:hypothetical protein n=1 Tax=Peribacillus acanthi TaxID=2171554 RepID=UPI0013001980|nr:hypothetical protein [Peribacillus acanthi]